MAFRIKDLMISIIPKEGNGPGDLGCPPATIFCDPHSPGGGGDQHGHYGIGPHIECNAWSHHPTQYLCGWTFFCPKWSRTAPSPYCCHHTRAAGLIPVAFIGDPELAAEQLAALKAQLKEAIAEIEAQEKIVAERLQPQTDAEIDELLAKLKEAQAELGKKRSGPKKR
jgi:hypothetical protein